MTELPKKNRQLETVWCRFPDFSSKEHSHEARSRDLFIRFDRLGSLMKAIESYRKL